MTKAADKYYPVYIAIILILLIPALFINLGLLPLIADEATRAIVSLEMELSGKLITPTINGEFYFNKPPLYNWILLSFFQLSGNHSEWIIRLPALISLLLFGLLIYTSVSRYTSKRIAFVSALAFITSGRILFYDSMLGLIDLTFSLLIFLNFILIYHFGKNKKYWALFTLSYLLASLTFLMKGMPAIVFQGITIITAMLFFKEGKKLFRLPHFAGILIFLGLVGGYYLLLWEINPDDNYFKTLISQSTQRTFVEHGIWKSIIHLFTFPPEQFYQLLPWSLLTVFLIKRDFLAKLKENQFLYFLALVLIVNIPLYWISVESYPRYIFMLYPIIIILLVNQYYSVDESDKSLKLFGIGISLVLFISLIVGTWLYFHSDYQTQKPFTIFIILSTGLIFIVLFLLKIYQNLRLELLIIFLLIIRISFNVIVLPERERQSPVSTQKKQAIEVARLSVSNKILLHPNTPISVESIYYISRERMEILEKSFEVSPGVYYIFDARAPISEKEVVIYSFRSRWKNRELRLSQFE